MCDIIKLIPEKEEPMKQIPSLIAAIICGGVVVGAIGYVCFEIAAQLWIPVLAFGVILSVSILMHGGWNRR